MQITFNEITNNKYVQIYLTKEELEKKETKEIIEQVIEAVMIIKLNNNNFRAFKIVFLP